MLLNIYFKYYFYVVKRHEHLDMALQKCLLFIYFILILHSVWDVLSIALNSEGSNHKQLTTMQICSNTLWTMNNPKVKFKISL